MRACGTCRAVAFVAADDAALGVREKAALSGSGTHGLALGGVITTLPWQRQGRRRGSAPARRSGGSPRIWGSIIMGVWYAV